MIRRPPRSTQSRSSAASDVYKRQGPGCPTCVTRPGGTSPCSPPSSWTAEYRRIMSLPETSGTGDSAAVDPDVLRAHLDGRWRHVREQVREHMLDKAVLDTADLDTEGYRALVLQRMHDLVAEGHSGRGFPVSVGGDGDIGGSVVSFEMLGFGDLSLLVKAGVQWGLFGGAVQALGSDAHHEAYLPSIMDMTLPGCFAMTETGHGSDVQQLATTATYDAAAAEFVVHTPHEGARKDYIGNAARDGRMAVVFAQLVTDSGSHGVHALLVPIRDEDGRPGTGVTISDCGRKAGLNGVDNGRLTFDHVRVPREALLHHARHAGARAGQRRRRRGERDQVGARDRGPVRRGASPVPAARPAAPTGRRGRRPRLPLPPAAAAAGDRPHVRAALRPGRAGLGPARRPDAAGARRPPAARDRVARCRDQGPQHLSLIHIT